MQPYIRVGFEGMERDLSVEASAHRWVARLEATGLSIQEAAVGIACASRRDTVVHVRLALADGSTVTAAASRDEIYVAVADAFRAARRQLLAPPRAPPAPARRASAARAAGGAPLQRCARRSW